MVANFSVAGTMGLMGELSLLVRVSRHNADHERAVLLGAPAGDPSTEIDAQRQSVEQIGVIGKLTKNLLLLMPCSHISAAADRLQYWADREDKRWDDLFTRACALRDAIQTEFKDYAFYAYSKEKGQKLNSWRTDWKTVLAAFPDTESDIFSATDCYALQHPTASVFHSMRVAEIGLRAVAKERRIKLPNDKPVEWANWQEVIRALDNEIKAIGGKRAGKTKDAALGFYSGARADLNGFKDEYRNTVMHVRERYDEFQALRALTKVHAFMERVAEKIDHTHQRIKWGRF